MCSPTIALTVASVASAGLQYKQGKAQQKAQYAQQVRQNDLARKNAVARYASAQLKIRQELSKASQSDLRGTLKARKARATYIAGVGDAGGLALSGSTNALLANYQRTEGNFRNAIRNMGIGKDEFTTHSFRSMASTRLNELDYKGDVIEIQLSHAQKDKIRSAYNHAEYLPERKKMMQDWSDYLDKLQNILQKVKIKVKIYKELDINKEEIINLKTNNQDISYITDIISFIKKVISDKNFNKSLLDNLSLIYF